jgi:hypothetical protein
MAHQGTSSIVAGGRKSIEEKRANLMMVIKVFWIGLRLRLVYEIEINRCEDRC